MSSYQNCQKLSESFEKNHHLLRKSKNFVLNVTICDYNQYLVWFGIPSASPSILENFWKLACSVHIVWLRKRQLKQTHISRGLYGQGRPQGSWRKDPKATVMDHCFWTGLSVSHPSLCGLDSLVKWYLYSLSNFVKL